MFQHRDPVCSGKGHRPARAAFADDHADQRHADFQAFRGRGRNRLGLPALFRALAGIGAGRVDQRHHRQAEPMRQIHQPDRLAIAFGARHAEVALDPGLGVAALLMADHQNGGIVEARKPAHDRMVIGKIPVPRQRGELGEQGVDIVFAMRSVGVPCHLAFLPGGQTLVEVAQQRFGLAVQRHRFLFDIHLAIGPRHGAQLFGLAFDLGEGLFKLEIVHADVLRGWPLYDCALPAMQLGKS